MAEQRPAAVLAAMDRILEHRLRFAICALLARNEALSFSRLKQLLEQTDGSLGAQLRKLEDEGYVSVAKTFVDRRPVSRYSITPLGRERLLQHVAALQAMLDAGPRS